MMILDLETDGLLPELTKIHCAVAYDTVTKEVTKFINTQGYKKEWDELGAINIKLLPEFLDKQKAISCHNGLGFDLKVLDRLFDYNFRGDYYDTLLLSRILYPDLSVAEYTNDEGETKGVKSPHSVESWAIRFGTKKQEHTEWQVFSPEMLERCVQDTKIQGLMWEHFSKKMKDYSDDDIRIKNRWKSIISMEQRVWQLMENQADYGWAFDLEKAYGCIEDLEKIKDKIEKELVPMLPITVVQVAKNPTPSHTANGQIAMNAKKWFEQHGQDIGNLCGMFSKVRFDKFKLSSSDKVKEYLLSYGWEPLNWNFKKDAHGKPLRDENNKMTKTSPKIPKETEEWDIVAKLLNKPEISMMAEYNKASHCLSRVKGLIGYLRPDHRIEAQANSCEGPTSRMRPRIVANLPRVGSYYGEEMRGLFTASSENRVLVGCDASALEARCEAHYIWNLDREGAIELCGEDIHTLNAKRFGCDRGTAKSVKYGIGFGAGIPKIALMLGVSFERAKYLYEIFWEKNPGLKVLKDELANEHNKHGYLVGIDGRPLIVRYAHARVNTVIQNCGAIAMKIARVIFEDKIRHNKLDAFVVGMYHDEFQTDTTPDIADVIGKMGTDSIAEAGIHLKLNVPLTAEYKVGFTWAETH